MGFAALVVGGLQLTSRPSTISRLMGATSSLGAVALNLWCYYVRKWRRYPNQLLAWCARRVVGVYISRPGRGVGARVTAR